MSPAPHDIAELEPAELEALLAESGCEPFHARQVYRWIYRYGVTDFGRMTDLSRSLRAQLHDQFVINTPRITLPPLHGSAILQPATPLRNFPRPPPVRNASPLE